MAQGQVCVGPEFGADSGGKLVARTPRVMDWPGPGTAQAANGLLVDDSGGLWVPQTPKWMFRQEWTKTPGATNYVGRPGQGWRNDTDKSSFYTPSFTVDQIVNPSSSQRMWVCADIEWSYQWQLSVIAWVEVWGSYTFPGETTQGVPDGAIAAFAPAKPCWWMGTTKRRSIFSIAPGGVVQPSITASFSNVQIADGTATSSFPVLYMWRVSLSAVCWLEYPAGLIA